MAGSRAVRPVGLGARIHWTAVLLEGHLYSPIHFKLNGASALTEWQQLLSA
jgi:hypothetical protein